MNAMSDKISVNNIESDQWINDIIGWAQNPNDIEYALSNVA